MGTERRRGEGGPGDSAAHAAQARGGQGVWEISPLAVLGGGWLHAIPGLLSGELGPALWLYFPRNTLF